jgi:hypothetical protein
VSIAGNIHTQERAYYIWERQGRPYGRAFEHWLQAERELASNEAVKAEPGAATAAAPSAEKPRAKAVVRRTAARKKSRKSPSKRGGASH